MSRRNPFPGLSRVVDRHGKVRWRYRVRGVSTYIHGAYGSAEFRAAYVRVPRDGGHGFHGMMGAYSS